jgi:hypothetical protein
MSRTVLALLLAVTACNGEVDGVSGAEDSTSDDSADVGWTDDVGDSSANDCGETKELELENAPNPDVMLVVDTSGSMGLVLSNGESRWPIMKSALNTVVGRHEDSINFGMMEYPAGPTCEPGVVRAAPAGANASVIEDALEDARTGGFTPTHTTLSAVLDYFNGQSVTNTRRFVLLATDGVPNCVDGTSSATQEAVDLSARAAGALGDAGIEVFVLGFGDTVVDTAPDTLDAIAMAGGTERFYPATSPNDLTGALDAIAGKIDQVSCTYALTEVPPDSSELAVRVGDTAIARDPAKGNGWDYDPNTNAITFYGSSCEDLRTGDRGEIRVDYGCGGGPIVK